MNTILRLFYSFMLAWLRFDLAVARSTGRNPANIQQLQREISEYERLLFQLDWSLK